MPKKPLSKKALEFKTEKTLSSSEMKNVDTEKETSVHEVGSNHSNHDSVSLTSKKKIDDDASREEKKEPVEESIELIESTPPKKKRKEEPGYHGYILKLTNVKISPSKVRYFHAVMHNGKEERSLVSYNPSLHDQMEAARVVDKVIKIDNYLEKEDQFKGIRVLTLNDRSTIEYSTEDIPFESVKSKIEEMSNFSTVKEVLLESAINDIINIEAHVSLPNNILDTPTKYGLKRKREAILNDNSTDQCIKLAIWSNHIDMLKEEGSFKFQELRVKSFNGKYLTTTALTVIKPSSTIFSEVSQNYASQISTIKFPAISIDKFDETFYCLKCNRSAIPNGKFLLCNHCTCKTLLKPENKKFSVKLSFQNQNGTVTSLTMPHDLCIAFATSAAVKMCKEAIEMEFLTNTKHSASYDTKSFTIVEIDSL